MRCVACNKLLNNREATRKGVNTGEYLDLCDDCFSTVSDSFPYVDGHGSDDDYEDEYGDGESGEDAPD